MYTQYNCNVKFIILIAIDLQYTYANALDDFTITLPLALKQRAPARAAAAC